MTPSWEAARAGFSAAAGWFVATTGRVGDRWAAPGLGEWSVRDLVGHTGRALLTVEAYLRDTAGEVVVTSPEDYLGAAAALPGGAAAVARRGREAGAALGEDPAGAVTATAERVLALVAAHGPDAFVATAAGGMRLGDYLPTRTLELVVHTCDLVVALGEPPEPPERAAAQALELLGRVAARTGRAGDLLLAATGRRALPRDFTLL